MSKAFVLVVMLLPLAGIAGCGSDEAPASWSPPATCSLPFDPGPCTPAIIPVFAFADGACVTRTWGGCQGNANRFVTLEECMATCQGRPDPNGCTSDRVQQRICLACGPAGGCGRYEDLCAKPCTGPTDCGGPLSFCREGVCQVGGCI